MQDFVPEDSYPMVDPFDFFIFLVRFSCDISHRNKNNGEKNHENIDIISISL